MCRSAACHPWQQKYAFIGRIPTGFSALLMQFRAGRTARQSAEYHRAFAADFPRPKPPVDFR